MDPQQAQMLLAIQELEFTAVDLNLYLDTHPMEQAPLRRYNAVTQKLMQLKMEYASIYGPLSNFGTSPSTFPWQWIESPWPWEM